MTEEARPVVKNNKLLQYPSGESTDTGTSERTSKRAREGKGRGRSKREGEKERYTEKPRENGQLAPVTSLPVRFLRFSVHGGCPYAKG